MAHKKQGEANGFTLLIYLLIYLSLSDQAGHLPQILTWSFTSKEAGASAA